MQGLIRNRVSTKLGLSSADARKKMKEEITARGNLFTTPAGSASYRPEEKNQLREDLTLPEVYRKRRGSGAGVPYAREQTKSLSVMAPKGF